MRKKQQRADVKIEADWRSQALETLPELSEEIKIAGSPMYLWIEICLKFQRAYEAPQDDDLIRRIHGFAGWCLQQARDTRAEHDLFTCVIVGFYEDIPIIKVARADVPRWFPLKSAAVQRSFQLSSIGGGVRRTSSTVCPRHNPQAAEDCAEEGEVSHNEIQCDFGP